MKRNREGKNDKKERQTNVFNIIIIWRTGDVNAIKLIFNHMKTNDIFKDLKHNESFLYIHHFINYGLDFPHYITIHYTFEYEREKKWKNRTELS